MYGYEQMKFSTREDVEAPIDHVWAQVSDFAGFERQAMRRGAQIARTDTLGKPGLGSEWLVDLTFRGKPRRIEAQVVEYDAPHAVVLDSRTGGVEGTIRAELVELSPRRTRLSVSLDLKPVNISGRLLIQSLKFARSNLNRRFSVRVAGFAQGLEGEYRKAG